MDITLVKPVVSAAEHFLRQLTDAPVELVGGLGLKESITSNYPVNVLLGVKGPVKGVVRYSYDFSFIDKLIDHMGDEDTYITTEQAKMNLVKEVTSLLFEGAVNGFIGASVKTTRPTAYKRNDMPDFPAAQTVVVAMKCMFGKLEIGICLRRS